MPASHPNRALAFVYALTIFTSAFLLFQIQPMISKAILPWFGGTSAVWTVCLLFFQSLLFAGYAYAHFTNAWLRPGQQAVLHVLVLIAAVAMLYLMHALPDAHWQPRGDADPTRAILTILAISIGLPYFVLSATGPLLQAWFARSFPGRTPYRLYALSNVGSLLALLSYPFLFEREFDLTGQARLWSAGFVAFTCLCAYAAWHTRSRVSPKLGVGVGQAVPDNPPVLEAVAGIEPHADAVPVEVAEPSAVHFLMWLLLPAFASIVLMATTNHISTDVAVVPLLWIVPLALYLLTFIIAFDRPAWYRPTLIAVLTLIALYPTSALYKKHNVGTIKLYDLGMTGRCIKTAVELFQGPLEEQSDEAVTLAIEGPKIKIGFRTALFVNFATMFGICLLCHGQLARLKPHTRYLTAYYLMMSAGGALGGITVSLIAPHVFHTIAEWQIAIFVAAVAAVGIILSAVVSRAVGQRTPRAEPVASATHKPPGLWPRYLLIALLVPFSFMLLDLTEFLFAEHKGAVYENRNFFGALTIREITNEDPKDNELVLLNGTTIHGSQFTAPEFRGMPTSYYATTSGIGIVLNYFHANRPPGGVRIGDVGLGAGTLAAYALKFDTIVFYEINPTVIDIATSGKYFTYIADCKKRGAHCDIKLGDARLTLQREVESLSPPRSGEGPGEGKAAEKIQKHLPYHVLVLDAFSGDAVPTHLLTAEAMDIYLPRLATEANMGVDGALVIHVSNRYLDLDRVARGAAEYIGLEAIEIHSEGDDSKSIDSADWIVLTKNKDLIAKLQPSAEKPSPDDKTPVLWTDAHSSLFEILR